MPETASAEARTLTAYPHCFGCGESNAAGLRLKLRMEDECLATEFVPREEHQGWPGIVHGGVIGALLYEVLENFAYHRGATTMMKSSETRFRSPAQTGKKILVRSWLVGQSRRNMEVAASLTREDGGLIAEGTATLVVLSNRQRERLGLAGPQEE